MSDAPADDELAALRAELELSAFLNKGILTANREHAARIAELEAENALLHAAESRLAGTEDALAAAHARIAVLEETASRADAARDMALRRQRAAVERMRAAEGQRDAWIAKHERLRGALVDVVRAEGIEYSPSTTPNGTPGGAHGVIGVNSVNGVNGATSSGTPKIAQAQNGTSAAAAIATTPIAARPNGQKRAGDGERSATKRQRLPVPVGSSKSSKSSRTPEEVVTPSSVKTQLAPAQKLGRPHKLAQAQGKPKAQAQTQAQTSAKVSLPSDAAPVTPVRRKPRVELVDAEYETSEESDNPEDEDYDPISAW